ncbi:Phage Exonuclease [Xanthomonas phage Suba]|uniref:Phage Exonuclease n=1 Tax=Xanthomonas phage Suba TaxID=2674975 RepID=A0A679KLI6_9CAUD|nr:Phage Exonuclease [Xanthomonas phage Suba]CAA2409794.1 Phage Exonuclease [Xanthomonas phage Suba]
MNDNVKKIELGAPGVARALEKRIAEAIDSYCQTAYDDGHRNHLGASLIGGDCRRKLFYIFRWVKHHIHSGRMQRLFNRGHREEERFIEWLEGIGFKVWFENREGFYYHGGSETYGILQPGEELRLDCDLITEDNEYYRTHVGMAKAQGLKFPQYRVSDVMGHFGGSLDGIAILPPEWGIEEPVLVEFKTNGTGSSFNKLVEKGMAKAKPQHYAQTGVYGYKYNFRYCVYLNICKNDDNLHVEVVELNHTLGQQMIQKADGIIRSQTPPPKISLVADSYECSQCEFAGVCHRGEPVEINCRSCQHAEPIEGAKWRCNLYPDNGPIPKDVIVIGCNMHKAIE